MRKVDMAKYNATKSTLDMIQLQYYRAIAPVTPVKDDAALHAAGHLYASDRNGLFPVSSIIVFLYSIKTDVEQIPNFLGEGDSYSAIATLNHTVVFHGEANDYDMLGSNGLPKWYCIEAAIEHISHGRCMVTGTIWDLEKGTPVATYMQDGLIRFKEGVKQSLDGDGVVFGPRKEDRYEVPEKKLEKL
jgi:acyl-CoA thioesterase